jgi:hypothetical protein
MSKMKNSSFGSKRRREAKAMTGNPTTKGRLLNRAELRHKVADTRRHYSRKHSTAILLPDDPQKDGGDDTDLGFHKSGDGSYIKRKETRWQTA